VLYSGKAPGLPANIRLSWKGLPGTNTLSLLQFVHYRQKSFITLIPGHLRRVVAHQALDFGLKQIEKICQNLL